MNRVFLSPKKDEASVMDASKQMIDGLSIDQENTELNELFRQCELFLHKYKAYQPHRSNTEAIAIVAVFELQQKIVARRSYILGQLHQENLPF